MGTRIITETIREFNDEGVMTRESITETTEQYDEVTYVPTYYPYVVPKEEKLVPLDTGSKEEDILNFQESIQQYFNSNTDSGFPFAFDPGFGTEFLTGNPKQ